MGCFWEHPYSFEFAVWIDDTFIPQTTPGHQALAEYVLTGHYENWRGDLELDVDTDFEAFGRLLYESLHGDYEVTVPELDTFVGVAGEGRVLGAKVTGAGWGGRAMVLVSGGIDDDLAEATRRKHEERGFYEPAFYEFLPAVSAELVC